MLFALSKILPLLFFPVGFACLAGAVAAVLAWTGRRRSAAVASLLGAGVLYLASLEPVSQALLRGLEGRYPPSPEYPKSPAIVILGGAGVARVPPRLLPETNAYGDRLAFGARLFHLGLAPRLVVTGGVIPLVTDVPQTEASTYAGILSAYYGIDSAAVIQADESRNTREDALGVRQRLAGLGLPLEIILVTSAAHMPRSVALFRKQGFTVHPAPTDFHASARRGFNPLQLLPNEAALENTCYALHERIGYAAYRALGWL